MTKQLRKINRFKLRSKYPKWPSKENLTALTKNTCNNLNKFLWKSYFFNNLSYSHLFDKYNMNLIANASEITPENIRSTQHQAEDHSNVAKFLENYHESIGATNSLMAKYFWHPFTATAEDMDIIMKKLNPKKCHRYWHNCQKQGQFLRMCSILM